MKTNKSAIEQRTKYRLIHRIVTPLIVFSCLLTSTKSDAFVPDYAEVTKFTQPGKITINNSPVQIPDNSKLSQYKDTLAVPASYDGENISADIDLIKSGIGKLWIRAIAYNGSTTYYRIPCTLIQPQYTQAEITWSNGIQTACGEGMGVTNNSNSQSHLPDRQPIPIGQTKTLAIDRSFVQAKSDSSLRYYCSSVPNDGKGSGKISAGFTSIEAACKQSQEICESNNKNGCSIATMGEWEVKDPVLKMSVTCADGKSSSRLVSGAEIAAPGRSSIEAIVEQLFKELLGSELGNLLDWMIFGPPKACYLEVFRPDEILISPVDKQATSVVTTGLENGQIQVDVKAGRVKLRAVRTPDIIASQGDSYAFNGRRGRISRRQIIY